MATRGNQSTWVVVLKSTNLAWFRLSQVERKCAPENNFPKSFDLGSRSRFNIMKHPLPKATMWVKIKLDNPKEIKYAMDKDLWDLL